MTVTELIRALVRIDDENPGSGNLEVEMVNSKHTWFFHKLSDVYVLENHSNNGAEASKVILCSGREYGQK